MLGTELSGTGRIRRFPSSRMESDKGSHVNQRLTPTLAASASRRLACCRAASQPRPPLVNRPAGGSVVSRSGQSVGKVGIEMPLSATKLALISLVPRPGIEPGLEVPETSVMSFSLPGQELGGLHQYIRAWYRTSTPAPDEVEIRGRFRSRWQKRGGLRESVPQPVKELKECRTQVTSDQMRCLLLSCLTCTRTPARPWRA